MIYTMIYLWGLGYNNEFSSESSEFNVFSSAAERAERKNTGNKEIQMYDHDDSLFSVDRNQKVVWVVSGLVH